MRNLAFTLSILAALICLSKFTYSFVQYRETDYFILFAGVFLAAIGFVNRFRKDS